VRLQPRHVLGPSLGTTYPISGFRTSGVVLRERADIGCILMSAAVDSQDIVMSASAAVGVDLPLAPGTIHTSAGCRALWLTPRSWLVHCHIEHEAVLIAQVNAAFLDRLVHATRFADALCWLELSGQASLDLLTGGSFLSLERGDLPIGHAKRTLIAQIPAVVVHEHESVWLIAVERSRAHYFMNWLKASADSRDALTPSANHQSDLEA
jgi:heterotetrameric sarcosine oxidase gamma subunit